jgi:hypothetical protein
MKTFVVLLIIVAITIFQGGDTKFYQPQIKVSVDSLVKIGYPTRISEKLKVVVENRENKGKHFFIADTKENLIYFFNPKGNFIAKSPTIDGAEKQINSGIQKENALKTFEETLYDMGFKYKNGKWIDFTNKNRTYNHSLFYNYIANSRTRFFPSGTYRISRITTHSNFIGGEDNTFCIVDSNNKELALAIHGLYQSQYRIDRMNELTKLIKTSVDSPKVPIEYRKKILNNINNTYYNNSFGCINVPKCFLDKTRHLAKGSLLFVMDEN